MITDVRVQHEYDVFKSAGAISIRVKAAREKRLNEQRILSERTTLQKPDLIILKVGLRY